jgi:EAL domain-containing protein (putative c-di-GMP-specific phosphodiesterase class I)
MDATPGPTHIDQPTHAYCSEIKLGHALVSKLHTDSEIAKMVASVVRSAHRCGMSTCALELETIADLDQARALGIDLGQGAVFSDSLPAEETLAWVEREERVRSFKSVARARERVG